MSIDYSYKYVPTVRMFSEDESFFRVIIGPVGSGKSAGCVIEMVKRAMAQVPGPDGVRRVRAAVVRNTYPELRDTTMKTFFDWVKPGVHGVYKVAERTFLLRVQAPDGSPVEAEIIFKALDDNNDVRDLLSLELTYVWFNEIREIAKAIIDMMEARVGRFPAMKDGGPTWCGMFGDTNAPDTDHPLYRLLEEEPTTYPAGHPKAGQTKVKKFHQASGLAVHPDGIRGIPVPGVHAENLPYLRPGYYEDLAIGKDQDFIDVYIHAKYGYVRDGKPVYPNWKHSFHVAKEAIEIIRAYPLILGWDFGSVYSACVMCQQLPTGRFNVKHEFIGEYLDARQFSREIIKPFVFAHYLGMDIIGTGDFSGTSRAPSDGTTCFTELIDAGLPAEPSESNAWQPRYGSVNSLLTRTIQGGDPVLQVDPECKVLIKGFDGEYKYKRLFVARKEVYRDKPDKNRFSHPHDALQYAAMFMEKGFEKYRKRKTVYPTQKPVPTGAWT